MTTVNPNIPVNLFVSHLADAGHRPEDRQLRLRIDQVVQATVVDGGLDKLLEFNQQYFKLDTDVDLKVGQNLLLQVLQTDPHLEFKVLPRGLDERLAQLLPLLTRAYDWQGAVEKGSGLENLPQLRQQLVQLLNFAGTMPPALRQDISQLGAGLSALLPRTQPINVFSAQPPQFAQSTQTTSFSSWPPGTQLPESITAFKGFIENLAVQVASLPRDASLSVPRQWYAETRRLMEQALELPRPASALLPQMTVLLTRIQNHPAVSPLLSQDIDRLIQALDPRSQQPIERRSGDPQTVITSGRDTSAPVTGTPPAGSMADTLPAGPRAALSQVDQQIRDLVAKLEPLLAQKQGLSPELLGRLEGMLERFNQLGEQKGLPLKELEVVANLTHLVQLAHQTALPPDGKPLGVLAQLFGFHLERQLLENKLKDALATLKAALLKGGGEESGDSDEPLRRIELFQLCKSRLAEENVLFLPLPFAELEEGYLLAERGRGAAEEGGAPLMMSISLRLSALGNMRIDMLYGQGGLQLRLACENRDKMAYVQGAEPELREGLQSVPLQGVSFAMDARLPARQLSERLNPGSRNLLDERI